MKLRKKDIKSFFFIFAIVLVFIIIIAFFKCQTVPVLQRVHDSRIKIYTDQASQRNAIALKIYEMNLNRVLKEYQPKLDGATKNAVKEVANYKSCCAIIYYLAWDKIKNSNKTDEYMHKTINPLLDPVTKELAKDMSKILEDFDYELKRSTVQLAYDLAALNPGRSDKYENINIDDMSHMDIQQSLQNLGFNSICIGVSVIFDIGALYKSNFIGPFFKNIISKAAAIFSKQIARVAVLPALVAADGPSPVFDVLAILGALWTACDINDSREQFEADINASLHNLLEEAQNNAHKKSLDHANTLLNAYQKAQDDMGVQTLDQLK